MSPIWKRNLGACMEAFPVIAEMHGGAGAPKSVQLAQVEMFVHVFFFANIYERIFGGEMEKIGRFFLEKTEERMLSVEKGTFGNQKTCTKC